LVKVPAWVLVFYAVAGAAAMAVLTGGGRNSWGRIVAVFIVVLLAVVLAVVLRVRWRRSRVRRRRRRLTRRLLMLMVLVYVVFTAVAYGLEWVLPLGTPLAYAVQFLAGAVILGAFIAVANRDPAAKDAARLLRAEDRPGEFDQLIASRSRLMVCAGLAPIKEIEVGELANCLQQDPGALTTEITELAAAQYVSTRADGELAGRQWVSLTPEGRTRYHHHLAALVDGTA
jgi:DNA-binding MarR family transcriptional regulator